MHELQDDSAVPAIAAHYRLQFEPAQNAHVLLFPEGMIKLNGSGAEILTRCDGRATQGEIIETLKQRFAADVGADVRAFLGMATGKGWVRWLSPP